MKSFFGKIRELNQNMKLKQRMIVVYAIGCFLPLFVVFIIMFNQINGSLRATHLTEQENALNTQKEVLEASMDMAAELSSRFYFDSDTDRLALTRYADESDLMTTEILISFMNILIPIIRISPQSAFIFLMTTLRWTTGISSILLRL